MSAVFLLLVCLLAGVTKADLGRGSRPLRASAAAPSPAPPRHERTRVIVVIPAHNEERSIASTLRSIATQSRPVDRIVVVADNCTDRTAEISLAAGAEVFVTQDNVHKKAGALNQALHAYLPSLRDDDAVLITDADSTLDHHWVENALGYLQRPSTGAVCAAFHADEQQGLLAALQRNEYHRFARDNARRKAKALILSGVASLFWVRVLREIAAARGSILPGAQGDFYELTASTEDIELTVALRHLGHKLWTPKRCRAITDTMESWGALKKQRVRWQRGMIDTLMLYGWNGTTHPYRLRQLGMYLLTLSMPLFLILTATAYGLGFSFQWHPIGLAIPALISIERATTAHPRHRLLGALILPELLYDMRRSVWYWQALFRSLQGKEREWEVT
jgi:poly-beta-1,6-N-acetyl-D-glucosamine synthase